LTSSHVFGPIILRIKIIYFQAVSILNIWRIWRKNWRNYQRNAIYRFNHAEHGCQTSCFVVCSEFSWWDGIVHSASYSELLTFGLTNTLIFICFRSIIYFWLWKESLNSDGHRFHQYDAEWTIPSHQLNSLHTTKHDVWHPCLFKDQLFTIFRLHKFDNVEYNLIIPPIFSSNSSNIQYADCLKITCNFLLYLIKSTLIDNNRGPMFAMAVSDEYCLSHWIVWIFYFFTQFMTK
jgi:hypothetical protein